MKPNQRNLILGAIVVVLAALLWNWLRTRRKVLDPSNSAEANALFNQLNPGLAASSSGAPVPPTVGVPSPWANS